MKATPSSHRLWLGPLLIALAAIGMTTWTWNAWIDPTTDFGRELYVPWRLAEGQVLYRDIAYFNGPFSPYFNSLIFRCLGTGIASLVLCNLALWAVVVGMIYHLWTSAGDRFTATLACLAMVGIFSFNRFTVLGNYTWVCPYSHEITHGIALALAGICCVHAFARGGRRWSLALAGALVGCTLLTKVEVALAASIAISLGMMLACRCRRASIPRAGMTLVLGALVPPIIAFILLATAMPANQALDGVLGSWRFLANSTLRNMPMYRGLMGADHPTRHLVTALVVFVGYVALLLPGRMLGKRCILSALITGVLLLAVCRWTNRNLTFAGMGLATLIAVARWLLPLPRDARQITRATIALFSLLLLAKMALNVVAYHYGFALAMPATLTAILLVSTLNGGTIGIRASLIAMVVTFILWNLHAAAAFNAQRTNPCGEGADVFLLPADSAEIPQGLHILSQIPSTATLACIPDGTMFNYLSRRVNPTGQMVLLPGEMSMFQEDRVCTAFRTHPPDYILILKRDMREFGFKGFGQDYGTHLSQWIAENYTPIQSTERTQPITLMHRSHTTTQASTLD